MKNKEECFHESKSNRLLKRGCVLLRQPLFLPALPVLLLNKDIYDSVHGIKRIT